MIQVNSNFYFNSLLLLPCLEVIQSSLRIYPVCAYYCDWHQKPATIHISLVNYNGVSIKGAKVSNTWLRIGLVLSSNEAASTVDSSKGILTY